jgi:2,5-dioxopentanoate dehydrogenase
VKLAARLMPILELKAGLVRANGSPTGVGATHAMVHGYQYLAPELLPPEVRDNAGGKFPRLLDGRPD